MWRFIALIGSCEAYTMYRFDAARSATSAYRASVAMSDDEFRYGMWPSAVGLWAHASDSKGDMVICAQKVGQRANMKQAEDADAFRHGAWHTSVGWAGNGEMAEFLPPKQAHDNVHTVEDVDSSDALEEIEPEAAAEEAQKTAFTSTSA